MEYQKPINTIVLDTGAIIRNEPSVSTLLAQSDNLVTVPAIIPEIKDAATRLRVETTLKPFLTIRSPNPECIKFVTEFARKTGDLAVLSKPDVQTIALAYEIECEKNGGDWRLRRVPGQKRVNGAPPSKAEDETVNNSASQQPHTNERQNYEEPSPPQPYPTEPHGEDHEFPALPGTTAHKHDVETTQAKARKSLDETTDSNLSDAVGKISLVDSSQAEDASEAAQVIHSPHDSGVGQEDSESDSGGWVTPSNLKKKQAEDAGSSQTTATEPTVMQVAVLTTDFAMQNVILQINLNLLSPSLTRVKHLKTFVLRCHACFQVTKDMNKQFCPRCGQPSLTRVSSSINANGEFKLHLKKNMQWNHRGEKYSIPKPVHGSANGRVQGGGKGGWGNDLILAEDQKEYQRAKKKEDKMKEKNLMDEDYLPSILTGDRGKAGGRIKIGADRSVNSRKR